MNSPFVRRRRLAVELRTLREEAGVTADRLSRLIHQSRMKVSRLENARIRPDLAEVMKILDILNVTGDKWHEVIQIARDAAERGWWDGYGDAMGSRQRLYADIEYGARTIREYNQTAVPGIFQTPDYLRALVELSAAEGPVDFSPERLAEARLQRRRSILASGGPAYEVILDEVVLRRRTVPAGVMRGQLHSMIKVATAEPAITVRVLPLDAEIVGGLLPKGAFTLYTFPDPKDPPMAVVDTVNTDLVHSEPAEVARYAHRYEHLRRAALSPEDSVALLTDAAGRLPDEAGRKAS